MKNMKKWLAMLLLVAIAVTLTACGGNKKEEPKATEQPAAATAAPAAATATEAPAATTAAAATGNPLIDNYGFQWADTSTPSRCSSRPTRSRSAWASALQASMTLCLV